MLLVPDFRRDITLGNGEVVYSRRLYLAHNTLPYDFTEEQTDHVFLIMAQQSMKALNYAGPYTVQVEEIGRAHV